MSTEKKIVDYLHLYGTGIDIMTPDGKGTLLSIYPKGIEAGLHIIKQGQVMKGRYSTAGMHYFYNYDDCQPLLSKLEDITEEDKKEIMKINDQEGSVNALGFNINKNVDFYFKRTNFQLFHYLLKKGYWPFGDSWFDEGLIIDKKTLKS